MAEEIVGTVVGRWYVTAFGITFLVLASRHLGWRRTGTYAAVALVVGVIAVGRLAPAQLGLDVDRERIIFIFYILFFYNIKT